jgi:hypothetical protein
MWKLEVWYHVLAFTLGGGKWSALPQQKQLFEPTEQNDEWVTEQVWMLWRKEKSLVPARNKDHISSDVQPFNKTLHQYGLLAVLLDTFNNNKNGNSIIIIIIILTAICQ